MSQQQPARTGQSAVVVGGGLAGISAAIALSDAGIAVTLLEAKPRLGGLTSSFSRGGLQIDNGQHVFLRCCTQYLALLARLGGSGSVTLQDRFDVTVLTPGGSARLRRTALPAPLHLAGALARYSLISPADRLRVGRAAIAMAFARPGDPRLDQVRLGDWLGARGQRELARRRLWDLFVVSALNVAGDEASSALAAKVIKTGLLDSRDAADIGVSAVPLGQLHGQAAQALLTRLGAAVRLGAKVAALEPRPGGGFTIAVADRPGGRDPDGAGEPGEFDGAGGAASAAGRGPAEIAADGVVLAVPAWSAARLAPAAWPDSPSWSNLQPSPIVNVHVIYDRKITDLPFAAAVSSPVQWIFDRTRQAGLSDGQYLAVSLSAAADYATLPVQELRELFLPALAELFPAAAGAGIRDFFVTREPRATFAPVPGCGAMRPGAATPLAGLVLAGAWTDTGWPDTMEGAVRSGLTAASQLLRNLTGRPAIAGQPQVHVESPTGAR